MNIQHACHTTPFADYQKRVDCYMKKALPPLTAPPIELHNAMHYAVFNGGKRIRPILLYLSAQLFTDDLSPIDPAAAAVEWIHCYSLVHDDLPAMDDDDYRRGKPSTHFVYGEALAILAGNALQSLAFEALSDSASALRILAHSAGSLGLIGGQALDLHQKKDKSIDLNTIHLLKTASLFQASVKIGALIGGNKDPLQLEQLSQFGTYLGLAYQAQDDYLDQEGSARSLSNSVQLFQEAIRCLEKMPIKTDALKLLCQQLKHRTC